MVLPHRSEIPLRHRVQRDQAECMKRIQRWLRRSHNGRAHTLGRRVSHRQEATPVQFDGTQTQARVQELQHPRMPLHWEEELTDRA